jgi:hypothetical protein
MPRRSASSPLKSLRGCSLLGIKADRTSVGWGLPRLFEADTRSMRESRVGVEKVTVISDRNGGRSIGNKKEKCWHCDSVPFFITVTAMPDASSLSS